DLVVDILICLPRGFRLRGKNGRRPANNVTCITSHRVSRHAKTRPVSRAGHCELELCGDRVERARQVGADGAHHGDGRDGDQRRDQAILDRGGTVLVPQQLTEKCEHSRLLLRAAGYNTVIIASKGYAFLAGYSYSALTKRKAAPKGGPTFNISQPHLDIRLRPFPEPPLATCAGFLPGPGASCSDSFEKRFKTMMIARR